MNPDKLISLDNPELPFEDNSVDEIFSDTFIHHVAPNKIVQLFREFHRVIKPGGVINFIVPLFPTPACVEDPETQSLFVPTTFLWFDKKYFEKLKSEPAYGFSFNIKTYLVKWQIRDRFLPRELRVVMEKWDDAEDKDKGDRV